MRRIFEERKTKGEFHTLVADMKHSHSHEVIRPRVFSEAVPNVAHKIRRVFRRTLAFTKYTVLVSPDKRDACFDT